MRRLHCRGAGLDVEVLCAAVVFCEGRAGSVKGRCAREARGEFPPRELGVAGLFLRCSGVPMRARCFLRVTLSFGVEFNAREAGVALPVREEIGLVLGLLQGNSYLPAILRCLLSKFRY